MKDMTPPLPLLPPEQPIAMPPQDFARGFADQAAPPLPKPRGVGRARLFAFVPAVAGSAVLGWIMAGWFADNGLSGFELTLLALITFNFFWICFTVTTVLLGLGSLARRAPLPSPSTAPMRVALLAPIYNEVPWFVLGNARSMLEELHGQSDGHRYAMFILSDTRDDAIAAQELEAVTTLRASLPEGMELYYRRRPMNTDRKVGNIADWIRRWGGGYDAMLVLDADSLMTGKAIGALTTALAADPSAGLIQSFPQLIGAQSLFARMQQFANGVYGIALAEGLARWCGQDGNYWGHNAIIRTAAFANCAGLPRLRRWRGADQLIMSHDFVEAGLLRRAGWGVRFIPQIRGSYEESPPTLIDHILRDRRWCQGNLQHLRLLGARGFRAVSRFHMFHGAIGYLMSPIWFALLVMWALLGRGEEASVLTYFNETNPLMPSWPDMADPRHGLVIVVMYAMLLAPKLLAALALPLGGQTVRDFEGGLRFSFSVLTEILLAILYAPILMVQQMIAVFRTMLGLQSGWAPQARDGGQYGVSTILLFHALETLSGIALWIGIATGYVSLWLAPIALSLVLAVPLSLISGWRRAVIALGRDPAIMSAARHYRNELKSSLEGQTGVTPAE